VLAFDVQVDGSATPGWAPGETPAVSATPGGRRGKSRWDETPAGPGMMVGGLGGATPGIGATPMVGMTPLATPMGGMDMPTPSPSSLPKQPLTAEQHQAYRLEREIEERNRPLSDEELDAMLPSEGYKILEPPAA
jgi:splicing factor 3B subunit 1